VVSGGLGGCAGKVFRVSFVAGAGGEDVSRRWEGAFDDLFAWCVALGWSGDLDESGGLRADFGSGRVGGKCPYVVRLCLT